jgi:hypothetical protein
MASLSSTRGAGAPRRRLRRLLGAGALSLGVAALATGCATPVDSPDVASEGADTTRRSTTTTERRTTTTVRRTTTTTAAPTTTTTVAPTTTTAPPPPPPTTTTAPPPPPPPPTTAAPAPAPAPQPVAGGCHPSYSPCVQIASDVDCAGGSGNGPGYTGFVTVIGPDEYDLDRDGDGTGCE